MASTPPDRPGTPPELPDLPSGPAGFDPSQLLRMAQEVQSQLADAQAAAAEAEVVGQAGGGMVKVTVTGSMEFRSVRIDPEAVDPADVGMLEDLVLAALHDATAKAKERSSAALGGLDLGGLGGLGGLLR